MGAHKSHDDLQLQLDAAMQKVKLGGLYSHFKHPDMLYVLETMGFMEGSEEITVGYRSLYGKGILWFRSLTNFLEEVEVDGKKVKRFAIIK